MTSTASSSSRIIIRTTTARTIFSTTTTTTFNSSYIFWRSELSWIDALKQIAMPCDHPLKGLHHQQPVEGHQVRTSHRLLHAVAHSESTPLSLVLLLPRVAVDVVGKGVPQKVIRQRRRLAHKESSEEGRHGHGRLLPAPLLGSGNGHPLQRRVEQSAEEELHPEKFEPGKGDPILRSAVSRQQRVVIEQHQEMVTFAFFFA